MLHKYLLHMGALKGMSDSRRQLEFEWIDVALLPPLARLNDE